MQGLQPWPWSTNNLMGARKKIGDLRNKRRLQITGYGFALLSIQ